MKTSFNHIVEKMVGGIEGALEEEGEKERERERESGSKGGDGVMGGKERDLRFDM